ncbi:MAG: Xaa-Pro aminopeptidase [Bacteroidetes bacterium HGW-Bacteroidetes-17]|jgi:Xaa-Pro aminopeptidase|nr:MAG: Xaa-Pro aminopeptidase [Bacteroidetes bacterium HGW-Bacteroidetes-17]
MFKKEVYIDRRNRLKKEMSSGLALIFGNSEASYNYPANTYHFRQDSDFLYFFGLDHPDFVGVIDIDNGKNYIFANDVDIEDIIWMGPQPSVKSQAALVGVENTAPYNDLADFLATQIKSGRKVHFLPYYRGDRLVQIKQLLGLLTARVKDYVSVELVKAVIKLRSIKDKFEIAEIEKAIDIAYDMHTTAMKMAKVGIVEREIAGTMEGISLAQGGPVSFPVILTINGQTLHNHYHGNTLTEGRMMIADAGAETTMHYSSDITRTTPVGGKFSQRQKEIYEVVLNANMKAIELIRPGIEYREVHLASCKVIAEGMKALGLMKGDMDAAVKAGAHALFMPHGLGHMMGLDVHDMEGLGENFVGYDEHTKRSNQFGTAYLRLGRKLQPGFVLTVEPGCYFIPELIDKWKKDETNAEFINFDKVETYKDFGGVRIEDDVLVTETGNRVLGKPIPKTVAEVEAMAASK